MRIKNVLQYLESTARALPDRVAFSDGEGGESLTFAQLLDGARRVGSALCRQGLSGQRVGLLLERHPSAIAVMLGVLYAGACYVPLDTAMPQARMTHILAQARVDVLVCDGQTKDRAKNMEATLVDAEALLAHEMDAALLDEVRASQLDTDPTYIIFTSGSTGAPKGVIGCHRAVIDYGEALTAALGFDGECVFGCQSPLYFDAPLKEILTTLMCGATTYLIPRRLFSFPVLLMRYLNEHRINTVCWVSSALSAVAALGALEAEPPRMLRQVVFGSEVFPLPHYRAWRRALPNACFWQLYGPTEATGMSCYFHADRDFSDGERIPIGRPLDNTGLLLLDEQDQRIHARPGERSAIGEIVLRGSCLTLGYDHDAAQTLARFVQNPLQDAYPETVYRTGDLAQYNERGELEFLGRRDGQIKRMGHRLEPGELEAVAMRAPGVHGAACVTREQDGEVVLFYVGDATPNEVRDTLRAHLPRYFLPRYVKQLDAIPLTDNGKTDRRALACMAWED